MLRKLTFLLIAALSLSCLCSCSIYNFSRKQKRWNPYKAGQKIVFRSQAGKTDTIYIMSVEAFEHTAPMALISDVNHSIAITARVPNPFTNVGDRHFTHSYQTIVGLHTNDGDANVDIHLDVYGHCFVSEMNSFKKLENSITMTLGGKTYNDIIIFECNNEKYCSDHKAMRRLYWSNKFGIVQYTVGEEEWNYSATIN